MIKRTLITMLYVILSCSSKSQGINFLTELSWNEIKLKAKAENKYIMLDTYATWCGPCIVMNKETFTAAEVGQLANERFISAKAQMDRTGNDASVIQRWYKDAENIGIQYKVTSYPTILFFSPDGQLVHRTIGFRSPNDFIEELKVALDPERQFYSLLKRYNDGKLGDSHIGNLIKLSDNVGEREISLAIANSRINKLNDEQFFTLDNLLLAGHYLTDLNGKGVMLFLKNTNKINQIVGQRNFAENAVMEVIHREAIEPFIKSEHPNWTEIENRISKTKYSKLGLERLYGDQLAFYLTNKEWAQYGEYYIKYFELSLPNERSFLHINNFSWPIVEHLNDTSVLKMALKVMKYNIERFQSNDPSAIDTYSNLLYKAGYRQEAIRWEHKALELSNNDPQILETLNKMLKGLKIY